MATMSIFPAPAPLRARLVILAQEFPVSASRALDLQRVLPTENLCSLVPEPRETETISVVAASRLRSAPGLEKKMDLELGTAKPSQLVLE